MSRFRLLWFRLSGFRLSGFHKCGYAALGGDAVEETAYSARSDFATRS